MLDTSTSSSYAWNQRASALRALVGALVLVVRALDVDLNELNPLDGGSSDDGWVEVIVESCRAGGNGLWGLLVDVDFDQSRALNTRKSFINDHSDAPILVIGTHFATPSAGHIVTDGDTYRLVINDA